MLFSIGGPRMSGVKSLRGVSTGFSVSAGVVKLVGVGNSAIGGLGVKSVATGKR